MKRSELAHILPAASRIADETDIVVFGSQSILGSFDKDDLPDEAVGSVEADVTFWNDARDEKADIVDGAIGEGSDFHRMYGYYASDDVAGVNWSRAFPFRNVLRESQRSVR